MNCCWCAYRTGTEAPNYRLRLSPAPWRLEHSFTLRMRGHVLLYRLAANCAYDRESPLARTHLVLTFNQKSIVFYELPLFPVKFSPHAATPAIAFPHKTDWLQPYIPWHPIDTRLPSMGYP